MHIFEIFFVKFVSVPGSTLLFVYLTHQAQLENV